jgi:hypothetical protein
VESDELRQRSQNKKNESEVLAAAAKMEVR